MNNSAWTELLVLSLCDIYKTATLFLLPPIGNPFNNLALDPLFVMIVAISVLFRIHVHILDIPLGGYPGM
jgi:hypothetical protein